MRFPESIIKFPYKPREATIISNAAILVLMIALAIIASVFFFVTLIGNRGQRINRVYLVLCGTLLGWLLCEIIFFSTRNDFIARYVYDLKIPFVAFTSAAIPPYVLLFYRKEKYLTRPLLIFLVLIPSVTTLISVTSPWHGLLRETLEVTTGSTVHKVINVRGPWFWIHTVYCYGTLIASEAVIIYQHYRLAPTRRNASNFLLFGVTITFVLNLFAISNKLQTPFDLTLVGMCVTYVFLYIGNAVSERAGFLSMARNEIFNYMRDSVFIVDTEDTLVDMNPAAVGWLDDMGLGQAKKFGGILSELESRGAIIKETVEEQSGLDIYYRRETRLEVYNLEAMPIVDDDGEEQGMFYLCTDVTKNRMLINHLSETAEIDSLTGLQNRYGFDLAKDAMDIPVNLPLAVVFGDINGLKVVNDKLGHKQGDEMLKTAARLLEKNKPVNAMVYRIGGDEFIMLVPNYTAEETGGLISRIYEDFYEYDKLPFKMSIALGYAVKEDMRQGIGVFVDQADARMYAYKRQIKNAGK